MMLKLYICGYLNQLCSSRRLEREAGRNVELIWLTGKLAPDLELLQLDNQRLSSTRGCLTAAGSSGVERELASGRGSRPESRCKTGRAGAYWE
jgi:hypothetical protein